MVLGHDLPAGHRVGRWFHPYLILDLYSRKILGGEVHETDDSDHAAHLVRRTALADCIAMMTVILSGLLYAVVDVPVNGILKGACPDCRRFL